MKKILAIWMSLVLMGSVCFPVFAESAIGEAEALHTLGLFEGTDKGYELEKSLTRAEAITLLMRVLGKKEEAEKCGKTHPFTDVAPWADGYVSYAYNMGITKGVSDTHFGAEDAVESNMYLTFLLRALGYADDENADFIWQMPYALAANCEMLPPDASLAHFTRNDAVLLTAAALFAKEKEKDTTLAERLTEEGVFTEALWQSAFPEDPFLQYKAICRAIDMVIPFHEAEYNRHNFQNYVLMKTEEKEDGIHAFVLISDANYIINEKNEIVSSGSGMTGRQIVLDKKTYEVISVSQEGIPKEMFPESAIGTETNNLIWKGMNVVLGKKVDKAIGEGILAYRQPSYAEALKQIEEDSINFITKTIETDICTILIGTLGGVMHGPHGWVQLLYKPGSSMGEGKMIRLPLPAVNAWGGMEAPENITLSEDGKTATYSFFFDSAMILDPGMPSERVIHEAGTYQYTVDLASGETSLVITNAS